MDEERRLAGRLFSLEVVDEGESFGGRPLLRPAPRPTAMKKIFVRLTALCSPGDDLKCLQWVDTVEKVRLPLFLRRKS
jgi:hypothetical protein